MQIGGLLKKPTTLIIGKSVETEGVELMRQKRKREKKLTKCSWIKKKIKLSFAMSRRGERERLAGRRGVSNRDILFKNLSKASSEVKLEKE